MVFLGVVVAGYTSYDSDTASAVLNPYRWAAGAILAAFALSLLSAGLAVAWLATGTGAGTLYESMLWSFVVLLVAALGVAVFSAVATAQATVGGGFAVGYRHGFAVVAVVAAMLALVAALAVPSVRPTPGTSVAVH